MLAAAARDAKSKAIVLKSLAFASLPEEIREEAELRAAATEYIPYALGLGLWRSVRTAHPSDPLDGTNHYRN